MVLRCDFCVEPRLVRVDLKNLEFFNGMLLQFSVLATFLKSTHNSKLVEFRSLSCIIT